MGLSASILSTKEELEDIQSAIRSFLETYGDCEVKVYEPGALIEEDGLVIHGEYGVLDNLLSSLSDPRLSKAESLEDARSLLKWNLVIYSQEEE